MRHPRSVYVTPSPTEWDDVARSDPEVLVSQTPAWSAALSASRTWVAAPRMYEARDGRRIVVPLARRELTPAGAAVAASPPAGWGFGGIVADGGVRADDVAMVLADLRQRPGVRVSLRPNPLQADRWCANGAVTVRRSAHVVDLRPGIDAVWTSLRSRTEIRRASRCVDVETDTTGRLLPVFFELLDLSVLRWARHHHEPRRLAQWRGRRRDSLAKWQRITAAVGERCRVSIAWARDRPAAGAIVLQDRNAHYTRGAMDRDLAAPTRANAALQWRLLCDAAAAGCAWYHMGESGDSASLASFKERFGAVAHDYVELRYERLPWTAADRMARHAVKRLVGFRES